MQTAQTWARTQLKNKYIEDYRTFYLEELSNYIYIPEFKDNPHLYRSKAESKAKTRLSHVYCNDYRTLYEEATAIGCLRKYKKNGQ